MTYSPFPYLVRCPHCGEIKPLLCMMSGNTFGAIRWSDAKLVAPMLDEISPVQKCPKCKHYFWLTDDEDEPKLEQKHYDFTNLTTGWLGFADALQAHKEIQNLEKEKQEFLNVYVVWAFNDIRRDGKVPSENVFAKFKKFVLAILSDEENFKDNPLLRAELFREIGDFDSAQKYLELAEKTMENPDEMKETFQKFREKIAEKNSNIFKL